MEYLLLFDGLITKNAAIMYVMYIMNGVHRPEPRLSGGNTSSKPQVSALIPRPAFNGMERMCQCHGSNQNSHPPALIQKPLSNQFIHNQISSKGVFGINHFKLCNFAGVAIECFFKFGCEAVYYACGCSIHHGISHSLLEGNLILNARNIYEDTLTASYECIV